MCGVHPSQIHEQRLATQRLTGPAASSPEQVVGELLAVQSQDAPLARLAIAQRFDGHTDAVAAALDAGRLVRTHVLRPTWHYVLRDDLAWLLELTAPRILSGNAARHRQLGLDDPAVVAGLLDAIAAHLADGLPVTRHQLQAHLLDRGLLTANPLVGQQMAHVLLQAELNALVASGPLAGREHTYTRWDAPAPGRDRPEAIAELTHRFFAHHGPASVADLMRWVRLNGTEIRRAIAALGNRLAHTNGGGVPLYFAPDSVLPPARPARAHLISTFDEAFLSYRDVRWPRAAGHPLGDDPYRWAEAGGGPVLCDLEDVGTWRRVDKPGRLNVRLSLATGLSASGRREVTSAAERAAAALAGDGATVTIEHAT
jgi:Winged helix DNA-binding domain